MEFGIFLAGHWLDINEPPDELFQGIVDEAVLAEELGFDTVWFAEHYFNNYIAQTDPLQIAAIVADRTQRIKLGTAVLVLPFHHPLQLAGRISQLDQLSKGRVISAFGRGAFPFEMNQLGTEMTNEESRKFCAESFSVISKVLESRMQAVDHHGEHWSFENLTIVPPAYSDESTDLWLAAQSPESAKWAVEVCVANERSPRVFCSQLRQPFSFIESVYSAFTEALQEHGIPREDALFAVNQTVFVADTDQEAIDEAFKTVYPITRGIVNMQAVAGAATGRVVNGVVTDTPFENEPSKEELMHNTAIGSPETVIAALRPYREAGIDHLSLHTNIGLDGEAVKKSMRLTAEHIIPALR